MTPVFAPRRLAEQTQSTSARDLLSNRRNQPDDTDVRESLRQFLEIEAPDDRVSACSDRSIFIKRFLATSNKVALQTLRQQEDSQATYTE